MSDRKAQSEFAEKSDGTLLGIPRSQGSLPMSRDSYSPEGFSKHFVPASPVKSEASEHEDCAPWVTNSGFSPPPRKCARIVGHRAAVMCCHSIP